MKQISALFLLLSYLLAECSGDVTPIDRKSVVKRHNITNTAIDSLNSLTLGNGKFAFTTDITGLQTFPEYYSNGIPLGTMSEWGWYTAPNPQGYSLTDVCKSYTVNGRTVNYVNQFREVEDTQKASASEWLRANPLRIHLGLIGLAIQRSDGNELSVNDITNNTQTLDLWDGELTSSFKAEGVPVTVTTVCHPGKDMISAKIESDLLTDNRLGIKFSFPVTNPVGFGMNLSMSDEKQCILSGSDSTGYHIVRDLKTSRYHIDISGSGGKISEQNPGVFILIPDNKRTTFEFSCRFSEAEEGESPETFQETAELSGRSWESFWSSGGAIDFSGCTDPRAYELERRVILSRYLTQAQCRGSYPPAETGLTCNSWYGKFHLEMHWWHSVHFALWQHGEVLEKQMDYYFRILENARNTAIMQGYDGVRWPKMTDREGRESPSTVGTYLIWQQAHPLFFAELLYRNSADKETTLKKYSDLVDLSADFMASYFYLNPDSRKYQLGPVLIPAQESLSKETTINPVFELVYWYWGIKTAAEWKKRNGEEVPGLWLAILENYPSLPVKDGVYLCSEDTKDSFSNERYMKDHPISSGISGMMPYTELVENRILQNTLDTILKKWNWSSTWGWDFPMLAMSAASTGRGEQAIDFLLMDAPKNRYLLNGHNYQDARLSLYLPGNGGLLTAVARMCTENQFPSNGRWKVRWENLNRYPE